MANRWLPGEHTGRLAPHHHTSYGVLLALLALVAVLLAAVSLQASAADGDAALQSQQGNVGVAAAVTDKQPTTAPHITHPGSGQELSTLPVDVGGSCPSGFIVKLFSNDILIGAGQCSNGSFTLPTDLFFGRNTVVARAYNNQGQGGLGSDAVGATFAPTAGPAPGPFQQFTASSAPANQLFLKADVFFRGGTPGSEQTWPLEIAGGTAPYAVSISWGDGKTDVYSRAAAGRFDVKHAYGGSAQTVNNVVIKASDASGNNAYLQLISVPPVSGAAKTISGAAGSLAIAWPLLGAAVAAVIAFFIGEWREKRVMSKRPAAV